MGSERILKQLSLNSEMIAHVFRAMLTPSGYLYDPPTPEMKGKHSLRASITGELIFENVKVPKKV